MDIDDLDLTDTQTPEELDAILDKIEHETDAPDEQGVLSKSEPPSNDDQSEPNPSPPVDSEQADSASAGEDEPRTQALPSHDAIEAKDGKNIIPYHVLEQERATNKALKAQLDEYQSQQLDWEETQRRLELRNKQLEKLGIPPDELPEKVNISDEQLDALTEDYPDLAYVLRHLVAKVNHVDSKMDSAQASDPVSEAIAQSAELTQWQRVGGEQWQKALDIDDALRVSPEWANKPLTERFEEVVRQTHAAFVTPSTPRPSQQSVQANVEEQLSVVSDSLPVSPSEVGSPTTHEPSVRERMATANEDELMAMMGAMSDEDMEHLLASL